MVAEPLASEPQREKRKAMVSRRKRGRNTWGIGNNDFLSIERWPMNRPPTHKNCQARRSNGPSWTNGRSLSSVTTLSLTCICAMIHTEKLRRRTVFHPHRLATQKAPGVSKENKTYIGRMSIKGGRKTSANDPPIAAHGFAR